jgi:serine/threonine protein kinase
MKKLNHPNIVKLLDVYYTINNCYIVTEFCEGGSLQHYIDANDKIEAEYVIKQIGSACQYLASVNILHRDIKPANILLKKGEWKLGDFGFS